MAENSFDFEQSVVQVERAIEELRRHSAEGSGDWTGELRLLQDKLDLTIKDTYSKLTPWQRCLLARHPQRPYTLDYVRLIFTDFVELHGDRAFADDIAIVGGLAFLDSRPVVVIGHQKGRSVRERTERNFGMPHPEGFRKALRLMRLAEKFRRPVVTFIDTPGAYPGIGAEERGQAEAIARNLMEMTRLSVPILVVVIGEGGSGGALGIGVGDVVLMLQYSIYSVCSPEACASILWHTKDQAEQAAAALQMLPEQLLSFGIIDKIIEEPLGGAHRAHEKMAASLKKEILVALDEISALSKTELMNRRYDKLRRIGRFTELPTTVVGAEQC